MDEQASYIGRKFKSRSINWGSVYTIVHENEHWVVLEDDPEHWGLETTPKPSLCVRTKRELNKNYREVYS